MGRKNLTGQRFGALTVIREGPPHVFPRGTSERTWVCRCDCGNETTQRTSRLTCGLATSCGCSGAIGHPINRHKADVRNAPVDLTGKVFGCFTVLGPDESVVRDGKKIYFWRAQCALCGGVKIYSGDVIRHAFRQKSCGCRKRGNSVEKECSVCGAAFTGSPKSKYCPACRKKREAESRKKWRETQKKTLRTVEKSETRQEGNQK